MRNDVRFNVVGVKLPPWHFSAPSLPVEIGRVFFFLVSVFVVVYLNPCSFRKMMMLNPNLRITRRRRYYLFGSASRAYFKISTKLDARITRMFARSRVGVDPWILFPVRNRTFPRTTDNLPDLLNFRWILKSFRVLSVGMRVLHFCECFKCSRRTRALLDGSKHSTRQSHHLLSTYTRREGTNDR